jgi:hypothetical protein
MNRFFAAIGHFFKHIAVIVSDAFVKLFGADIAHTFAVGAESLLHSELGKIAWTAVQEAQALATGTEKNAAAFAKIVAAAKAAGIEATDSIVNMLIEIAVQKLKGAFGPAPAA